MAKAGFGSRVLADTCSRVGADRSHCIWLRLSRRVLSFRRREKAKNRLSRAFRTPPDRENAPPDGVAKRCGSCWRRCVDATRSESLNRTGPKSTFGGASWRSRIGMKRKRDVAPEPGHEIAVFSSAQGGIAVTTKEEAGPKQRDARRCGSEEEKAVHQTEPKKMIRLMGSDGKEVELEKVVAMKSHIIRFLIEDCNCAEKVIRIPDVTSSMLSNVFHCNKLVDIDFNHIYDLTMAADYLRVEDLLNLISQQVADLYGQEAISLILKYIEEEARFGRKTRVRSSQLQFVPEIFRKFLWTLFK